jgi:hypothetical protein
MAIAKRITLGSGDPKRLFVGGLHGDEWMHTSALLESLDAPETGTLVIIPKLTDRTYVSTLDDRYYEGYGRDLVAAIEEIKPAIYLELHSYRDFEGLTDFRRIDEKGVPAYVELEDDFCISFEIPAEGGESQKLAKELLDFTKDCVSAARFVDFLLSRYPEQGRRAIENYRKFYGI